MSDFWSKARTSVAAPIMLLAVIAMFVVPLPPIALDTLFIVNIVVAVMVLMTCIQAKRPLDFSVFPTVLLLATIFRLSLNVASTRVILLNGATGTDGAGQVIEAFGEFVIGGNFIVGIVVFVIITIINFIVITKGAERISEVGARFSLDSMPGKQMSVDADLGSGTITQEEAAERRRDVGLESQFYGNLDGTSKAVKGDAVAGILILLINIIGGLAVGMTQYDMSFGESLSAFTIMSIGDGLVAIIPSIIMALATAIIVSRVNGEIELTELIQGQLLNNPIIPAFTGSIIFVMGLIPAMPTLLLFTISGALFAFSYQLVKKHDKAEVDKKVAEEKEQQESSSNTREDTSEVSLEDIKERELVRVELGYSLSELAKSEGSSLITAIKGMRKQLSKEFGVMIKGFYITASPDLEPNEYRVVVQGIERGKATVHSSLIFAMDNSGNSLDIPPRGDYAKEPVYGLGGYWVMESDRGLVDELGYTTIEPAEMITAHCQEIILKNLEHMIDTDDLQILVDKVARDKPKLVEIALPSTEHFIRLLNVVKELLRERVAITQLPVILETMASLSNVNGTTPLFVSHVRKHLAPWILAGIEDLDDLSNVQIITFSDSLTAMLESGLQPEGNIILSREVHLDVAAKLNKAVENLNEHDYPAILITSPTLRKGIFDLFGTQIHKLNVLDWLGLPSESNFSVAITIGD
ncbi:Flagellar biosynthesis protein FlhA [Vibrio chagasii]|nr:Flagellar biosynthesis protein FlhA [Vibrio chagasii]